MSETRKKFILKQLMKLIAVEVVVVFGGLILSAIPIVASLAWWYYKTKLDALYWLVGYLPVAAVAAVGIYCFWYENVVKIIWNDGKDKIRLASFSIR